MALKSRLNSFENDMNSRYTEYCTMEVDGDMSSSRILFCNDFYHPPPLKYPERVAALGSARFRGSSTQCMHVNNSIISNRPIAKSGVGENVRFPSTAPLL